MPGSEHNWKHFITQRLVGKFITEDITTFFYLDSKEDAETEMSELFTLIVFLLFVCVICSQGAFILPYYFKRREIEITCI